MARHCTLEGPIINRRDLTEHTKACDHPVEGMEWRRDFQLCRWVGICLKCGRGRVFHYGDEPFVVTDEEIANGLFAIPFIYVYLMIPYETW